MSPQRAPTASRALADWPAAWGIGRAQRVTETAGSHIWRVWRRGEASPCIVKLLKDRSDAADELRGAHYLRWRAGEGAVRLIDQWGRMLLLEDAGARALSQEPDARAIAIAAAMLARLQRPGSAAKPRELQDLRTRYASLFARASRHVGAGDDEAAYAASARLAQSLLDAPHAAMPLHGDLHHDNVMHGSRGWLAIDPKGVLGDAAFDAANWFYNPWGRHAVQRCPARIRRLAAALAQALGCTPTHVLRHGVAYGGLSATWFSEDGNAAQARATLDTQRVLRAVLDAAAAT